MHALWYRLENQYAVIPYGLELSHLDVDKKYIDCVLESTEMNNSRKYCHLFAWYKTKEGEDRPRCPHWENPCRGPK